VTVYWSGSTDPVTGENPIVSVEGIFTDPVAYKLSQSVFNSSVESGYMVAKFKDSEGNLIAEKTIRIPFGEWGYVDFTHDSAFTLELSGMKDGEYFSETYTSEAYTLQTGETAPVAVMQIGTSSTDPNGETGVFQSIWSEFLSKTQGELDLSGVSSVTQDESAQRVSDPSTEHPATEEGQQARHKDLLDAANRSLLQDRQIHNESQDLRRDQFEMLTDVAIQTERSANASESIDSTLNRSTSNNSYSGGSASDFSGTVPELDDSETEISFDPENLSLPVSGSGLVTTASSLLGQDSLVSAIPDAQTIVGNLGQAPLLPVFTGTMYTIDFPSFSALGRTFDLDLDMRPYQDWIEWFRALLEVAAWFLTWFSALYILRGAFAG